MSTFHEAVFEMSGRTRQDLFDRCEPIFMEHKVSFVHSVRGLNWDPRAGRFVANMNQELEDLPDFREAFKSALGWECACFDFRFLNWEFEFYFFRGRPPHAYLESAAKSFPDNMFKTIATDGAIGARWLSFLIDVGIALDRPTMVCGTHVLVETASEANLIAKFRHHMETYISGSNHVHTLLCRDVVVDEQTRTKAESSGFSFLKMTDDYQLVTKVNYDKELIRACPGFRLIC